MTQADEELRTHAESPDAAAIEACLDSLMKATEEYLEERREAHDRFKAIHHAQPELSPVSDDLQVAIEQQDEQIENAGAAIEAFDYENNLEDGCLKMVGETGKLIDGSHQVRDTLDEAMVRVTHNEQRLGELHSATRNDPLTEIANRAGLEASLFEWWESDPQRVRQLCVAMIDIDYLAQINQEYGYRVGDQLLRTVAQFLKSECRGVGTVARFSGQRFLFLFPDTDIQVATNLVERVWQMIEMSHFHYHEFDIPVTVSCAVTGTTSEDTSDTLIARAEATLQEAKRYGRNRTFMHEGKYCTPVVPPNFSLEEKHITL